MKPRIALTLATVFAATLVAYALLMVLGGFLLGDVKSFTVVFSYMGLLAPLACMYLGFRLLRLFSYPANTASLILYGLVGFAALSVVNLLMGYVSTSQGSLLGWKPTVYLAIVQVMSFVCPIVFLGKRLIAPTFEGQAGASHHDRS